MGKCPQNSPKHIFLTQKNIMGIIRLAHYLAHTEIIFKELGILPIEKVFIDHIGDCMMKELYMRNNEIYNYGNKNCKRVSFSAGTLTFSHVDRASLKNGCAYAHSNK